MKKNCVVFLLILNLFYTGNAWAQSVLADRVSDEKKFNQQGDQSFNIYYGYSVSGPVRKLIIDNYIKKGSYNIKENTVQPIGLMYEYLIRNQIGFGGEIGYSNWSYSFDYNDSVYTSRVYTLKVQKTVLRIMMRANVHFNQSKKSDTYAFVSFGYHGTFVKASTNDPAGLLSVSVALPFFFGVKPGIGTRYFFNDYIGLHAELALGTPIISGGLSVRF